jgi:hypothetical protein
MFSFRYSHRTPAATASPEPDSQMLFFEPRRIVRGIKFHLLDSRAVSTVNLESCEEVVTRLAERGQRIVVHKDRWAAMNDPDRLQWLLDQSHVTVQIKPDKLAILQVR